MESYRFLAAAQFETRVIELFQILITIASNAPWQSYQLSFAFFFEHGFSVLPSRASLISSIESFKTYSFRVSKIPSTVGTLELFHASLPGVFVRLNYIDHIR